LSGGELYSPPRIDQNLAVITSIEIEGLRGIKHGKLDGLAPLSILTGPNGCGKSTVLDAIRIGHASDPLTAVGEVVKRHATLRFGARWLFRDQNASVVVGRPDAWKTELSLREASDPKHQATSERLLARGSKKPFLEVTCKNRQWWDDHWVTICSNNEFESPMNVPETNVRLIDTGSPRPLHLAFSNAYRQGRKTEFTEVLKTLIADLESIDIATEDDGTPTGTPTLHLARRGYAVPAAASGDGIQAILQLALELAWEESCALIEEPEVFQHPRSIWQIAKILLGSVRRGKQIVLTTHSLELIDALIDQAAAPDIEKIALFNMVLRDGELVSSRLSGEEVKFERGTIEKDLR
jgi:AAA domain, putative AbiEii toxin, Type IV TA system